MLVCACACTTQKKLITQEKEYVVEHKTDTLTQIQYVYIESDTNKESNIKESESEHITIVVNEAGDTISRDREYSYVRDSEILKENLYLKQQNDSLRNIHNESSISISETDNTEYVYVEKELSGWQKFKLNSFFPLVGILLGCLVYIFRRPVFKIAKAITHKIF